MTGNQRFKVAYAIALQQAVAEHPEDYTWLQPTVIVGNLGETIIPTDTIENVTRKMFDAMDKRSYNKDGRAFKLACKSVKIPHTYRAINAMLDDITE